MILLLVLNLAAQAGEAIFLDNARIWDGTNAPPTVGDVLVIGDRIVGMGPELSIPEGAQVVDLSGKTLRAEDVSPHEGRIWIPLEHHEEQLWEAQVLPEYSDLLLLLARRAVHLIPGAKVVLEVFRSQ